MSPTRSDPHTTPPPPDQTTANASSSSRGGDLGQSSRSRVGFVDSPEVVNVVGYSTDDDVPFEPTTSWGETRGEGGREFCVFEERRMFSFPITVCFTSVG